MEVYEKALKVVDIKMTFRCSKEVVVSLLLAKPKLSSEMMRSLPKLLIISLHGKI